jgi:hypothetical protein
MTPADPDTGQPADQGGLDVIDAGLAIEGILAREDAETEEPAEAEPERSRSDRDQPPPRKREAAAEPPPETPEEGPEPETEGEEEATTETEDEPEKQAETPLYTVKIDGKEEKVTLDELQRGYSGQKWITQKSQALAQERKALETESQAVRQERAVYAQYLSQLAKQIETGGEVEPDWEKLRAEDEFKWLVELNAWNLKQQRRQGLLQEQQRVATLQRMDLEEAKRKATIAGTEKLLEVVPAWKDAKKFAEVKAEVREYAKSLGFSDEEIAETYDHRAVLALHKAAQWDKLVKARLKPAPNARPATARPGSSEVQPGRPADLTRLKQRLAKTGSVEDAAAFFEQSGVVG